MNGSPLSAAALTPASTLSTTLVSVIMPAYNRERLIVDALESVRKQSHRPLEILVVDDASTDQTAKIAELWASERAQEDLIIRIIRQEENRGVSAARNRGLREATGDYITFLDSDDVLAANSVDRRARVLDEEPELDFTYEHVLVADAELSPLTDSGVGQPYALEDPIRYDWHTLGALYRREFLNRLGAWNEHLRNSEDWEYHTRAKLTGAKARYIGEIAGCYRQHNSGRLSATRFNPTYVENAARACMEIAEVARKNGSLTPRLAMRLARRLIVHAMEFGSAGRFAERDRLLQQAAALAGPHSMTGTWCNVLRQWRFRRPHGTAYALIRKLNG